MRYMVVRLTKEFRSRIALGPVEVPPFAVQRISEKTGASEYIAYFTTPHDTVKLEGRPVPKAVLSLALRLPEGASIYCDEDGNETSR